MKNLRPLIPSASRIAALLLTICCCTGVGAKNLPLPGEVFEVEGREAFVILPSEGAKPGMPWVWYAPTLPRLPGGAEVWMFERFLAQGIAIAGIDVGESFGSPNGRRLYTAFYKHLTKVRGLGGKPVLLARSRGGLMLYSWAVENPESVGGIAGIYPVCNVASYPGVKRAANAYELTPDQLTSELAKHNPVDRLKPLADAGVPLHHIHGDNDKVVPLADNSGLLAERYRQLGGKIELDVIKGGGHDGWAGWFRSVELTRFVMANALGRAVELEEIAPISSNGSAQLNGAKWIWHAAPATHSASKLRKRFELKDVKEATLYVTCDNGAKVYINDRLVITNPDWHHPNQVKVGKHLRAGMNLLRADATNTGGIGGFIASLVIRGGSGNEVKIQSDVTWEAAAARTDTWKSAVVLASYGDKPWGRVFDLR